MQTQFDKVHPGPTDGKDCLCPPVCFQCPPPFCLPCGPGPSPLPSEENDMGAPRQCGPFIMLNTPVGRKTIMLPPGFGREMYDDHHGGHHEHEGHHEHHGGHHHGGHNEYHHGGHHREHRDHHKNSIPTKYKHNHRPDDDDRHDGYDDSALPNIEKRKRGYHKHYNGEPDQENACCEKKHHHHHGGQNNLECCEKQHHHHHHHDDKCKRPGKPKRRRRRSESSDDETDDSVKEEHKPARTPRPAKKSQQKGIRNTSRELRAGKLYVGCDCEKRNGMQDDCQRSLCMGSPECCTNPPTCLPSEFSNGKHLAKRREEAERKIMEKYKKMC